MDSSTHRQVLELVRTAGQLALQQRDGGLNVRLKDPAAPHSIVTDADELVSDFLTDHFREIFNGMAIISEEDPTLPADGVYKDAIVIDPIDGTSAFARGESDFSVLVGFIKDNVPVDGFAYFPDPSIDAMYFTNGTHAQCKTRDGITDVRTPFRDTAWPRMNKYGRGYLDVIDAPVITHDYGFSSGIAMMEGRLDLASGPSSMCDWDIAAFDAIARKSGGMYVDVATKQPMRYGEKREAPGSYWTPRYLGGHVNLLKKLGVYTP